MKEIEDLLKKAPLVEPSPGLDRRVEVSVQTAQTRQDRRPAMVPLWAFAAGCLACTLIGFLIHPLVERPKPPAADGPMVVYVVEPSRPDLRIFGTQPQEEHPLPFFEERKGEVKPLRGK
jgi:hypothetical protein